MRTEERNFTVHPHILYSIIQNQAGTLAKALLEGVMNSIDAGATRVSIQLNCKDFTIRDDGKGFQSKDEILNWFEQFGTPHEEGDAVYGRFRMGRGMMMAFAVNTWRTGSFQMDVDIKGRGLDYSLTEKAYAVKGCRIDGALYVPLSQGGLDEVIREFSDLVRYAQIPVSLNGRVISKLPALQSWDEETNDAYIKTSRTGDLYVYNLGVLVRSYPQYCFGCGGVIVSKRALEVNFARNDIITHKCEVWGRIADRLKRINLVKVAYKNALNNEERSFLAKQWVFNNIPAALELPVSKLKLFTDANGKHHSLSDLASHRLLTVARESQARTGARLHREGKAFVLSEETLERFRVESVQELVSVLERITQQPLTVETQDFDQVALGCVETYQVHDDSELSVPELCALETLRMEHDKFYQWFSSAEKSSGMRELKAGSSDVAEAWTDGKSFIVLSRKALLAAAEKGELGFFELLMTLTHEYCHDDADLESHSHDLVFYNKHHDLVQYRGGRLLRLVKSCALRYAKLAKKAGVQLPLTPSGHSSRKGIDATPMAIKAQLPLFA